MKKSSILLCFLAISIFSLSCNKDDEAPDAIVEGDYKLVEVLPRSGVVITEAEIEHIETYSFTQDGTFVKSTSGSNYDGQASGTFTIQEAEPNELGIKHYLILSFETGTEFTLTCGARDTENLRLLDDGKIVNHSGACDLVISTYQKVI